jgi:hypothetical protein
MYAEKFIPTPRRSTDAKYSGNVEKSHGIPALSVSKFMSSTFSSVRAITSWCSGRVGAIENSQFPATTLVTPWKHKGVSAGSQNTCAS